jgi:hypothetical protein
VPAGLRVEWSESELCENNTAAGAATANALALQERVGGL